MLSGGQYVAYLLTARSMVLSKARKLHQQQVSMGIVAPHLSKPYMQHYFRCRKCGALTTSPEAHTCWAGGHPVARRPSELRRKQ